VQELLVIAVAGYYCCDYSVETARKGTEVRRVKSVQPAGDELAQVVCTARAGTRRRRIGDESRPACLCLPVGRG